MEDIKIVGSRIAKIEAERNPDFSGKLTIQTNLKVNTIEKVKDSKETIKVNYNFEISYAELGKINLELNLFLASTQKTIKEILKSWEAKKFDTEEQIAITNILIQKASIKAITLEEELGLPIHIRLPSIEKQKTKD